MCQFLCLCFRGISGNMVKNTRKGDPKMNAQEIIEYIRTSQKKTPVKVYVWEKETVEFPKTFEHISLACAGHIDDCCASRYNPSDLETH